MEQAAQRQPGQPFCTVRHGSGHVHLVTAEGLRIEGLLRELGTCHLSAFLRSEPQPDGSRTPLDVRRLLAMGTAIPARVQFRGETLGPLQIRMRSVERSWIRGYDVVVVADILTIGSEDMGRMKRLIEEETRKTVNDIRPHAIKPPVPPLAPGGGETICVTLPARRCHATVFRNICEVVARQAGFSPRDVFMIKLAADEVFTNAVIHGSQVYGLSHVHGDILLGPDEIVVSVRDEGGRPFNFERYRQERADERPGAKSGLHVVDRVVDSWSVRIEQGKFTEVVFRKKRRPNG